MSLKSFILQSLFVLLFCTSFLSAMDSGHLGPFRLDAYNGLEAYVASIDYGHTPITKQLLVSEAIRVWDFLPKEGGPGMLSALSAGDGKIYFATSIKGPAARNQDLGFPDLITDALSACKENLNNLGAHVHSARCAELMVIAEWFTQNGGWHHNPGVQLPRSGKSIVAVNYKREVVEPCSDSTPMQHAGIPFGCADVLPKLGFKPDEIVKTNPNHDSECQLPPTRRSFGGLRKRGCVPKKPTTKPSPPGKPAPKNQRPSQGKPKPAKPKTPAKPKAPSNRGPKPAPPRLPAKPKTSLPKRPRH